VSNGRYRVCQIPLSKYSCVQCVKYQLEKESSRIAQTSDVVTPASAGICESARDVQILNFTSPSCDRTRKANTTSTARQWALFEASRVLMPTICFYKTHFYAFCA
jgi:hypothetical protein